MRKRDFVVEIFNEIEIKLRFLRGRN